MHTASRDSLRILVVDDVPDIADMLSLLLEGDGHRVETAGDADTALQHAAGFQPNVVLLDVGLPNVDGLTVAKKLRERMEAAMVIIGVSGWARPEDVEQARNAGFDHYLTKPVDIAELKKLLAFHQSRLEAAADYRI